MSRPTKHNHRSVVNYIENLQPLVEKERQFIYHNEDLVTFKNGGELTWFDSAIERLLEFSWMQCKPIKVSRAITLCTTEH